jgi:hypothetical protein
MSFAYSNDYEEVASVRIPEDGQLDNKVTEALALLHLGLKNTYASSEFVDGELVAYPIVVQLGSGAFLFYRTKTHAELRTDKEQMEASRIQAEQAKQERLEKEEEMATSLGVDVEVYRTKLKELRGW